jgi:hypothetical protein
VSVTLTSVTVAASSGTSGTVVAGMVVVESTRVVVFVVVAFRITQAPRAWVTEPV